MEPIRKLVSPVRDRLIIDLSKEKKVSDSYEVIVLPVTHSSKRKRTFGYGKGKVTIKESFYEPLEDFKDYK